jgi:hypothetical protein
MSCIFCRTDKHLTDEHIFPAFMGGELVVKDGSCGDCNKHFAEAEQDLRDATVKLLNLLKIENRYGIVPTTDINAEVRHLDMKNIPAVIDGRGDIQLRSVARDEFGPDGKPIRRQGFFMTTEAADKFVKRALAKGYKVIEKEVPKEIVIEADYTLQTHFIYSAAARKVAAKIALAAIALQYGIPYALSPQFDVLRQVRTATGDGDLRVWVFANPGLMRAHTRTAHLHSVMCFLSAEWKKGWAIVTLFGGITYRVDVADNYQERDKQFGIYYDAEAKKRICPIVLADEKTLVGHMLSEASKFEDRDALDAQWYPIISEYCVQKGIITSRIKETGPDSSKSKT